MKLSEIDALIAKLQDDNDFPLGAATRSMLEHKAKSNSIPMIDTWEAAQILELEQCWKALRQLRPTGSAGG